MPHRLFLILLLMVVACAALEAQKKSATPEPAKSSVEKTAAELEAERVLRERRANAQSLLVNLAADARNFNDAMVRARSVPPLTPLRLLTLKATSACRKTFVNSRREPEAAVM